MKDKRLDRRLASIAGRLADKPTASLKEALGSWAEALAAYRFFDNEKTSVEAVLAPHRDATLERARRHERVLLIQDTTELDFSKKEKLEGAGVLNTENRRGFYAHNHLLATPGGLALGVWDTDIHARECIGGTTRKQLPIEQKESLRWLEGYRKACRLAELAEGTQVVSCSDREGDIYEVFAEWNGRGERGQAAAEWVVRSRDDRRLLAEGPDAEGWLRAEVKAAPLLGTLQVEIKKSIQWKRVAGERGTRKVRRTARTASLGIRAATVRLRPPRRGDRTFPPLCIQVVCATEAEPPEGEEPIEWILLSSLPADGFAAASEIIGLYAVRWEIEVFHRVLKTGCRVEELQLKKAGRAKVAIALYMVVAWRILHMTKLARECPDLPCDTLFSDGEWKSVWVVGHGREALSRKPTLAEFIQALARLGGFLGRRGDGEPGPQALWQGMARMRDFAMAWQAFGEEAGQ